MAVAELGSLGHVSHHTKIIMKTLHILLGLLACSLLIGCAHTPASTQTSPTSQTIGAGDQIVGAGDKTVGAGGTVAPSMTMTNETSDAQYQRALAEQAEQSKRYAESLSRQEAMQQRADALVASEERLVTIGPFQAAITQRFTACKQSGQLGPSLPDQPGADVAALYIGC